MEKEFMRGSFGQDPEKLSRTAQEGVRDRPRARRPSGGTSFLGTLARFAAIILSLAFLFLMFRYGCEGIVSIGRGERIDMNGIVGELSTMQKVHKLEKRWYANEITAHEFFEEKDRLEGR